MHIIHTCEIVISAGFHGAIVLRPFCTKYRLYGRMQKVYESIPFLCSFHDTSSPSPELNFCRYSRAIQLFRYAMNPVYVHENPGPFPAIKKSLREKRDVYFRILGAKVLKFDRPLAGGFLSLTAPNGQSIKRKALLWAGYGPTSTDLHILCRMCTARGLWQPLRGSI